MTTLAALLRRSIVSVEGPALRVLETAGTGPFTAKVRPIRWYDRAARRMLWWLTAPKRRIRRWQEARWDRLDAE